MRATDTSRHNSGESVGNTQKLLQSHTDSPLTNHGMMQARLCGEYLKHEQLTAVLSSDLRRARATAEAIVSLNEACRSHDIAVELDENLREQDFGPLENHSISSMTLLTAKIKESIHDEETAEQLRARAKRVAANLLARFLPAHSSRHHVLIVSHAFFLITLVKELHEMCGDMSMVESSDDMRIQLRMPFFFHNTGIYTVELERALTGAVSHSSPSAAAMLTAMPALRHRILRRNYHAHLEGLVRQPGGISSVAFDERQTVIERFFK